jgi:flagellar M-ring protein FliF
MSKLQSLKTIWRNLEPRGQLTLVVSALLVVVVGFALFHFSSRPTYASLQSGLNPAQTGKVTAALDGAGISYRITNGGTAVEVLQSQQSDARIALASSGVVPGTHEGWAMMDKLGLGTTDRQQTVAFQRALEGEIANTISGIDGVNGAEVHLVLPEDQLFDDEASQATAAVTVNGGSMLDPAAVKGIAHLVKSSVQGLQVDNVTITDETGAMLWPTGDGVVGGGASTKLAAEQRYSSQLAASIDAWLAQTLGPGKASVRVNAELDVDKATIDQVTYGKKGVALEEALTEETLQGEGAAGANGPGGVASNVPPYTQPNGEDGGAGSDYRNRSEQTTYGVDKKVEHREVAPGAIEGLQVALIVDPSVTGAQLQGVEDVVSSMAGLKPDRGDVLSVAQAPLAKTQQEAAATPSAGPLGMPIADTARYGALAAGTLAFLFLMRRALRRREGEAFSPEPTWLRDIQQAMPIAQLEPGHAALAAPRQARLADPGAQRQQEAKEEIEAMVKQRPQQVAQQVTQWLNES